MAKVVDIERVRVDRLADQLMPAVAEGLTGCGYYRAAAAEVQNVERWRRAARSCARRLGIKVRTGISTDGEWVWIVDETPSTPTQRAAALRVLGDLLRPDDQPSPRRI